jgi:hypothetical protein
MPPLSDFIGALLADAAQARVRADLETLKIAEVYSAHDLLKHLPVPRFRLPDITIDAPVVVTGTTVPTADTVGRIFDAPVRAEVTAAITRALTDARILLPAKQRTKVTSAAYAVAEALFKTPRRALVSARGAAAAMSVAAVDVALSLLTDTTTDPLARKRLESSMNGSLHGLMVSKVSPAPQVQVGVVAGDIKAHGNDASVVRVRLTISEDAYEVTAAGDGGPGFTLTPE